MVNKNISSQNLKYLKSYYSDEEKEISIRNLINHKQSQFYKTINLYTNISKDSDNCWYCSEKILGNKINGLYKNIIDVDNSNIGYFCSKICRNIFYFNYKKLYNLTYPSYSDFVPISLLTDSSKLIYKNLIKEFKDIEYNKSIINYEKINYNTITMYLTCIDNNFNIIKQKKIDFKLNIYTKDNKPKNDFCLYCKSKCINKEIINFRNNYIGYFCTYLCKDIYINLIKIHLYIPKRKLIFLPFYEIFKNKNIINEIIKKTKDNDYYTINSKLINNNFIIISIIIPN